jgi:hypothetical protein
MSNQRQIFQAISLYAADSDGIVIPINQACYFYNDVRTNYKWYTNILDEGDYIKAEFDNPEIGDVKLKPKSLWVCPSVSAQEKRWGAGIGLNERTHPYPSHYHLAESKDCYTCHDASGYKAAPLLLESIVRPDEVFSVADSGERKGSGWVTSIGIHPPNDPNSRCYVPYLKSWGEETAHEVAPRHLGKVVLAFFDTSVRCFSYDKCKSNYLNMFCCDEDGDGLFDL